MKYYGALEAGGTKMVMAVMDEEGNPSLNLLQIDVDPDNAFFCSDNGVLYSKEKATLIQIKERFALLQKCRSRFDKAKFEIEEENVGIDLDEI